MTETSHTRKAPEVLDWASESEQQSWFDEYKSKESNGLRFRNFQEFLEATIYTYIKNQGVNDSEDNVESKFSHQQEMQVFNEFDHNNDHILDFDEFSYMCQKWLDTTFRPRCALVIVDVQNDFIDGSLALINSPAEQDGAEVVPIINNLLEMSCFKTVVYTQDWHPPDHIGFYANLHLRKYKIKNDSTKQISESEGATDERTTNGNESALSADNEPLRFNKMSPKAKIFDTVLFDDGQFEQILWPTHCVQNSWGAQLYPKLRIVQDAIFIQKGTLPDVDAYSAFWDNMHKNETCLKQELLSRKISDVFFCGLALDYCVAASAIDSARSGFMTYVVEDACRGVDLNEIERRMKDLREHGVLITRSELVPHIIYGSIDECHGRPEDISLHTKFTESGRAGLSRDTIKKICLRRALQSS